MARRLLVPAALLLAAVVVWLVWNGRDSPTASAHGPRAAAGVPRAAVDHIGVEEAPRVGRREVESPAADGAVAAAYAAPSDAADAITVEVFDTATGMPADRAEVCYVDLGTWSEAFAEEAYGSTDNDTARGLKYGTTYRCDADGRVRVPPRSGRAILVATKDGRIGTHSSTSAPDGAETVRIALKPRRMLVARVLQADGSPAPGCRVAMAALTGGGRWFTVRTSTTDADGLAEFDHLQERGLGDGSGRPHLVVHEPLTEPVRAEIEPAAWPEEPVVLELPATGALDVQLIDRGEHVAEEGIWLSAVCVDADAPVDEQRMWRLEALGTGGSRESDAYGVVHFPYISAGAPLDLHLNQSDTREPRSARSDAVARAGATVRTHFQVGEPLAFVVARVVDAQGTPRQELPVIARLVGLEDGANYGGSWLITGPDGMLRLAVSERAARGGRPRGLEIRERESGSGVARFHVVPVPDPLASGDNHVGELVLGGRPLVGGVVVDPAGNPLGDVYLRLNAGAPDGEYSPFADVSTDADGSFLFDCAAPAAPLFLRVTPPDPFEGGAVRFLRGQTDLVITVQRDTRLTGILLLPDGVAPHLVRIDARTTDGAWSGEAFYPESDGRFHIPGIPPDVEFRLTVGPQGEEPLFGRTYRLSAGELAKPDELNPLDLRGLLHYHRLEVLHEDGSRPAACGVDYLPSSGLEGGSWVRNSNLFQVVSAAQELDVLAMAPGCLPRRVTLRGSGQVRLARGIDATIELDAPALPDGMALLLTFHAPLDVGGTRPAALRDEVRIPGPGRHALSLPGRHRFSVAAQLVPSWSHGGGKRLALPEDARQFDATGSGTPVYRLTLPADAFDGVED